MKESKPDQELELMKLLIYICLFLTSLSCYAAAVEDTFVVHDDNDAVILTQPVTAGNGNITVISDTISVTPTHFTFYIMTFYIGQDADNKCFVVIYGNWFKNAVLLNQICTHDYWLVQMFLNVVPHKFDLFFVFHQDVGLPGLN